MKFSLIILCLLIIFNTHSQTTHSDTTGNRIAEQHFVMINGIEQWVTIKGDRSKPVILFLHGGPGSTLSPYADAVYKDWEKDFILVQWDQRGAGRTYGRNAPPELSPAYLQANPLTVEQMANDGIELVGYLTKLLGKQKIILFGSSWGSVLGVTMIVKRPDLFYAYIGHSQVVNPLANLIYDYQKIYTIAEKAKDQPSLDILNAIGKPPYDTARNAGKLFRVIKKYEKQNSTPAPDYWFQPSVGYASAKDDKDREDGDDYSFANYVGDKGLGVSPMMRPVNFLKDAVDIKIPVYFIQGEEDILTPKEITKQYFDGIKAPQKKFIMLPKTAHGFNALVVETQLKIIREYVLPVINRPQAGN
jgi:pimeloyl-ACP methyl ester carboxylesterase